MLLATHSHFRFFTYFLSDITVYSNGRVVDDLIEELGVLDDEPAPKPHIVINVKSIKTAAKGVIRGKGLSIISRMGQNSHNNIE